MEKNIKSVVINIGLYLGALLAFLTVIAYAVDLGLLTNTWYGVFIMISIIVFGIISVAKTKQLQNGFASFKEAFTSFFITVLVGLSISTLISFLLFNFIDTDAADALKEQTIEKTVEMLKSFNTPSDAIAKTVEQIESQNQYALGNIVKGLAGYLVLFSIIGLLVSAAMKKSKPDTE